MSSLVFSSVLPDDYRQDLEELLYFNDLQDRVRPAILKVNERYGEPEISSVAGSLRVTMTGLIDVQTLFAIGEREDDCQLAGVVLFVRESDNLVILHLAVAPAYSTRGSERDLCVALRLVQTVRTIGRQLKGVTGLVVFYPTGAPRRLDIATVPPRSATTPGDQPVPPLILTESVGFKVTTSAASIPSVSPL